MAACHFVDESSSPGKEVIELAKWSCRAGKIIELNGGYFWNIGNTMAHILGCNHWIFGSNDHRTSYQQQYDLGLSENRICTPKIPRVSHHLFHWNGNFGWTNPAQMSSMWGRSSCWSIHSLPQQIHFGSVSWPPQPWVQLGHGSLDDDIKYHVMSCHISYHIYLYIYIHDMVYQLDCINKMKWDHRILWRGLNRHLDIYSNRTGETGWNSCWV